MVILSTGQYWLIFHGEKGMSDCEGHGHKAVVYKSHFPPLRHFSCTETPTDTLANKPRLQAKTRSLFFMPPRQFRHGTPVISVKQVSITGRVPKPIDFECAFIERMFDPVSYQLMEKADHVVRREEGGETVGRGGAGKGEKSLPAKGYVEWALF